MTTENTRHDGIQPEATVLRNLRIGLRVWLGEMKLLLVGAGRAFELRQLQRRLDEECTALGRHTAEHLAASGEEAVPPSFDMIRSARQVQFLQDEILRLRSEQEDAANRARERAPHNNRD